MTKTAQGRIRKSEKLTRKESALAAGKANKI